MIFLYFRFLLRKGGERPQTNWWLRPNSTLTSSSDASYIPSSCAQSSRLQANEMLPRDFLQTMTGFSPYAMYVLLLCLHASLQAPREGTNGKAGPHYVEPFPAESTFLSFSFFFSAALQSSPVPKVLL